MTAFRADLHCHTTCSDGSLTPKETIVLAKQQGLSGLSITDHDSIDAYEETFPAAKEAGISLISGIEFSAMFAENSVHILGYSFDLNNQSLRELCLKHIQRREERNRAMLELLNAQGMPLTQEDVLACASIVSLEKKRVIGRPHIALALIKKGYVDTVQNAFRLYLGEGRSCYFRGDPISVDETISVIHGAGGFAIIAHPHLIKNEALVGKLLGMNFDGLEGYYSLIPPKKHDRWIKIAKNRSWIITGGSDFHGDIKSNIPLGCSGVDEETFRILEDQFKKMNSFPR